MGGLVPNLVNVAGDVRRLPVRKRVGETYAARNGRVAVEALRHGAFYFAVRRNGAWEIHKTFANRRDAPVAIGLSEDAAAMWLQMRGGPGQS